MQRGPDCLSGSQATAVSSASARSPVAKAPTNRPAPPPFSSIMARRRRWLAPKEVNGQYLTASRPDGAAPAPSKGKTIRGRPDRRAGAKGNAPSRRLQYDRILCCARLSASLCYLYEGDRNRLRSNETDGQD